MQPADTECGYIKHHYSSRPMVQFEINIKLSTINGKGLNRLITKRNKKLSYRRQTALQGGGLDATYAVHLRFIRKPVVVFLFSLSVVVECATSEY